MRATIASIVLVTASLAVAACSSDDTSHPGTDAGAEPDATSEAGGDDAADAVDAASTKAMVRFAQFSPDAPALDVCVAPHGTGTYQGPLLAQFAHDAGLPADASAPGLSFANVSAYFPLDPGAYDVRLVPAGATTCAVGADAPSGDADASADADADADAEASADAGAGADADASAGAGASADAGADTDASADAGPAVPALPLPPDTTGLTAFVAARFTTVLLAGDLAPVGADAPFAASVVRDDTVLAGGGASMRAINALVGVPAADFGFGSFAASWSPLFTNVAFGAASLTAAPDQGKPDANGYLPIAPFGPGVFSVRASSGAAADVASSASTTVSLGAVATVVAAGGKSGDPAHPPVLVLCADSAPRGGALSVCNVLR